MKTRMLAAGAIVLGLLSFGMVGIASAQTAGASASSRGCLNFTFNMGIGALSGSVAALQNFLNANGYMSYASTGYFGPITFASVVRFQAAHGIPDTGFVGPLTRAEISALSCGNGASPSSVRIYGISPDTAPVGASVTVTGFGFTPADNTVSFAGGAISGIPSSESDSQETLSFVIPSSVGPYCPPGDPCPMYLRLITPGSYPISVSNANGTSASATLTVVATDPNPNLPLP